MYESEKYGINYFIKKGDIVDIIPESYNYPIGGSGSNGGTGGGTGGGTSNALTNFNVVSNNGQPTITLRGNKSFNISIVYTKTNRDDMYDVTTETPYDSFPISEVDTRVMFAIPDYDIYKDTYMYTIYIYYTTFKLAEYTITDIAPVELTVHDRTSLVQGGKLYLSTNVDANIDIIIKTIEKERPAIFTEYFMREDSTHRANYIQEYPIYIDLYDPDNFEYRIIIKLIDGKLLRELVIG